MGPGVLHGLGLGSARQLTVRARGQRGLQPVIGLPQCGRRGSGASSQRQWPTVNQSLGSAPSAADPAPRPKRRAPGPGGGGVPAGHALLAADADAEPADLGEGVVVADDGTDPDSPTAARSATSSMKAGHRSSPPSTARSTTGRRPTKPSDRKPSCGRSLCTASVPSPSADGGGPAGMRARPAAPSLAPRATAASRPPSPTPSGSRTPPPVIPICWTTTRSPGSPRPSSRRSPFGVMPCCRSPQRSPFRTGQHRTCPTSSSRTSTKRNPTALTPAARKRPMSS